MRWFLDGKKAQAKAGDSVTSYGPTRRFSVDTWHHGLSSCFPWETGGQEGWAYCFIYTAWEAGWVWSSVVKYLGVCL